MLEETILKRNYTPIVLPTKPHMPSLWENTIIFGLLVFGIIEIYYFVNLKMMNIGIANNAVADTSIIIIGLSFILSSICYFWDFADRLIIYRKQLGVVGFVFACIHALIIILYTNPILTNLPNYLVQPNFLSYSLALAALLMYGGMVIISTKSVIHKIGGKLWRELLRVGYIAYVFSLIHFILLSYEWWFQWFKGPTSWLPPFGIFSALFGILVILMRIALMIHKLTHAQPTSSKPL